MGSAKTTTETTTEQQAQATPEERELNKLALERAQSAQPGLIGAQSQGLELIQQLLSGGQLPGFLGGLPGGISPEVTSGIVQESLRDIGPSFADTGLLDSGVRASIEGRVSGDIRRASEEFNIGNRLNLLNLALSGQAQVQQPILGSSANLGQRLAGLRTQTGFGTSTQRAPNPFLQSFQQSLGSTLGGGSFKIPGVQF